MNRDDDILVEVEGLSKKFCKDLKTSLWYGVKDLITGIRGVERPAELRPKEFWAVKDVSFELRRGECLGLIGHNGAGKTTLIRIINQITAPDSGTLKFRGKALKPDAYHMLLELLSSNSNIDSPPICFGSSLIDPSTPTPYSDATRTQLLLLSASS